MSPRLDSLPGSAKVRPIEPRGRVRVLPGPEGATAPETLREKDRGGSNTLESAAGMQPPTK